MKDSLIWKTKESLISMQFNVTTIGMVFSLCMYWVALFAYYCQQCVVVLMSMLVRLKQPMLAEIAKFLCLKLWNEYYKDNVSNMV